MSKIIIDVLSELPPPAGRVIVGMFFLIVAAAAVAFVWICGKSLIESIAAWNANRHPNVMDDENRDPLR